MKNIVLVWLVLFSHWVWADDFRPASLTIQPIENNQFDVLFKVPIKANQPSNLKAIFDSDTANVTPINTKQLGGAYLQTWRIHRVEGLSGLTIEIDGLTASDYEVIVRIPSLGDGITITKVLTAGKTIYQVPHNDKLTTFDVFISYMGLGFEHILIGLDHLLFVLSLILLVSTWRKLILTITSFTVAHSLTLGAVTLNWFQLPGPPVEAVIALSIIFLAKEIVTVQRGGKSNTAQYPWVVAFVFGLLHGMGFAGVLGEIGLPENEILVALLSFNIGVELGQLAFVCVVLLLIKFVRKLLLSLPTIPVWLYQFPAYSIGTVASYWLIERLLLF